MGVGGGWGVLGEFGLFFSGKRRGGGGGVLQGNLGFMRVTFAGFFGGHRWGVFGGISGRFLSHAGVRRRCRKQGVVAGDFEGDDFTDKKGLTWVGRIVRIDRS